MRWKISHGDHDHGGHDPRQIDLIAIIALLIVIIAAFKFYSDSFESAPSATAFIVPSQTGETSRALAPEEQTSLRLVAG